MTRSISWLRQAAQADWFQHFTPAISTQSYRNSGLDGLFTAEYAPCHQCELDTGPGRPSVVRLGPRLAGPGDCLPRIGDPGLSCCSRRQNDGPMGMAVRGRRLGATQTCRNSCASAPSAARTQLRIVAMDGASPCFTDCRLFTISWTRLTSAST